MKAIDDALSRVILCFPPLGYISSGWKTVEPSSDIPTMGVTYDRLLYNEGFVMGLKDEEINAVLLHEILHCVFLHPTEITRVQGEGKDAALWTVALEIVVNAAVKEMASGYQNIFELPGSPYSPFSDKEPPAGPIYYYDPAGHDRTAVEIYEMLLSKGPIVDLPVILDIIPSDKTPPDAVERVIATLERLSRGMKGNIPWGLARQLKKLTKGQIPFDRILAGFVGNIVAGMDDISWERPDWRRPVDIVLPGCISEELDCIVVAVDTSGSISQGQIEAFASGIASLVQFVKEVTVLTTDAVVHEEVKIREVKDIIRKIKFKGCGGTNFKDVFTKVRSCQGMVFFTDWDASYPARPPRYPVLWVLTKEGRMPPFGRVAYVLDV